MFRFTIRDMLWLTALTAVGIGWWLELRHRGPENVKLRDENWRLAQERDVVKYQLDSKLGETFNRMRVEREFRDRKSLETARERDRLKKEVREKQLQIEQLLGSPSAASKVDEN